ncbi:hypothetical protein [Planosporangium sp. 12N6]|uniref:hypothetical protein n=1 Tax=Planosporangium spinosum TaxID=3402278 RepID=UPI003CF17356
MTETFEVGAIPGEASGVPAGLSTTFDQEEFLDALLWAAGSRLGCRYGVAFEVLRFRE